MARHIPSVICVTYTDEFSNNRNSHVDIEIGSKHKMVASNSPLLNKAKSGTIVQIVAAKNQKNRRQIQFGFLDRKIDGECHLWENAGPNGRVFKYHWTFTPLTDVLYMHEIREIIERIAERMNIDTRQMFNSRLCGWGAQYIPIMQEVIETRAIPLID
jgi:hypothetical protein